MFPARVSKTSEILGGIRALRQMGWEDIFERRVRALRDEELGAQRRRDTVAAYLLSYFSALPPFMIVAWRIPLFGGLDMFRVFIIDLMGFWSIYVIRFPS